MDGENHGSKPYEQMVDLGGNFPPPLFFETPIQIWDLLIFFSDDGHGLMDTDHSENMKVTWCKIASIP